MADEKDTAPNAPKEGVRAAKGDGGVAEVTHRLNVENERGYSGTVPDPTPNFNYTVAGNDAPTPETDDDLKAQADAAHRDLSRNVKPND